MRRIHQSNHSKRQNKPQYHFFFLVMHVKQNLAKIQLSHYNNQPNKPNQNTNNLRTQDKQGPFQLFHNSIIEHYQSREKTKTKYKKRAQKHSYPDEIFEPSFLKHHQVTILNPGYASKLWKYNIYEIKIWKQNKIK